MALGSMLVKSCLIGRVGGRSLTMGEEIGILRPCCGVYHTVAILESKGFVDTTLRLAVGSRARTRGG